MITIDGKEHPWREDLKLDALVRELGLGAGASFASVEERGADGSWRRFVRRLDWPATTVADGTNIRLIVAASGG